MIESSNCEIKRFCRCGTEETILYHIKNDRRSVRSAEAIYAALATLMQTRRLDGIKISELVEAAQVGRATFYRNFDTLEDVLHWRCEQVVEELFAYLAQFAGPSQLQVPVPFVKPILRFFYLHSDIVELLIKARRVELLQLAIQERLLERSRLIPLQIDTPPDYLEYGGVIRAGMVVSVVVHWIREGKRQAPDDLADNLAQMAEAMSRQHALL